MDTPLEESNLAYIGSDEDKAVREAAAKMEMHWEGAGQKEGLEIWRVENVRDENNNPVFGIKPWPKKQYGDFYIGDSYIVLQTSKDNDNLVWDIFFWIGSNSSQDEYGVASYKANELDDLLGDAPIQHREIQGNESVQFADLFAEIRYLDGGIDSGFRHVETDDESLQVPKRLFQIHRSHRVTRSFQVPLSCSSLNDGDAFLLDAGNSIYTWFGTSCSPFEKERAAEMAHNLAESRYGHAKVVMDVRDDSSYFWDLLGGKGVIKPATELLDEPAVGTEHETKMYVLSDAGGVISVKQVEADQTNLVSGDVCLVDAGPKVYVWIGKGSSKREQQVSMMVVEKQIKIMGRTKSTEVTRLLEGQESRCRGFQSVF